MENYERVYIYIFRCFDASPSFIKSKRSEWSFGGFIDLFMISHHTKSAIQPIKLTGSTFIIQPHIHEFRF